MDARHLAKALGDPAYVLGLDPRGWDALLAMADGEGLTASLARRLHGLALPDHAMDRLASAHAAAETERRQALDQIRAIGACLAQQGSVATLLGEAGWIAAGLDAARGCVVHEMSVAVSTKNDADAIAQLAGPIPLKVVLTAPDTAAIPLEQGLRVPAPEAMIMDAVLAALGHADPVAGLRGLWSIDRLLREFSGADGFWQRLHGCSAARKSTPRLSRALRLAHHLFATPVDPWLAWQARKGDLFYLGRILARNARGKETRPILRLAFRVRARLLG